MEEDSDTLSSTDGRSRCLQVSSELFVHLSAELLTLRQEHQTHRVLRACLRVPRCQLLGWSSMLVSAALCHERGCGCAGKGAHGSRKMVQPGAG